MTKLTFGLAFTGAAIGTLMCGLFGACNATPGQVGQSIQPGGGNSGQVIIDLDASLSGTAGNGGSGTGAPPTADANCGSITSGTRQPADVLLVLDRSGSMSEDTATDNDCGGRSTNCSARWPAVTTAVNSTLTATTGSIDWGLKLFSTNGDACEVSGNVEVAISATSVPTIQATIRNTTPGGATPTAQAIDAAVAYLKKVQDTNSKYILLATDGEPNCAGGVSKTGNVTGAVASITAAQTAGFPVYVIGIGPPADLPNLSKFAQAGGTGAYFSATTPQALTDAFATISKSIATCTYTSASPPQDPNNIAVYLNGNPVAKDSANGWSFGANNQTILLNGTSCAAITSSTSPASVKILFGCAGIPFEPPTTVIP